LEAVDFVETTDDEALYAVAADFSVETTEGTWRFSEHFTGCDSTLIIQDQPRQAEGWPRDLWSRDVDTFFDRLPKNTQVLFVSTERSSDAREASLAGLQVEVEDALVAMGESGDWWRERVVFVTERAGRIDGWLGGVNFSVGWGVGIDRFQRIRYIGSYGDPERYNESYGWFEPNLSMAANEAIYYNFEAQREQTLSEEQVEIVPVFTGDRVAGNVYVDVDLPSETELSVYDTLTLDLYMGCEGDGEYGDCPAWDYMPYLYRCSVPVVEENPHAATACQPAVEGVDAVEGECHLDGASTSTGCAEAVDCEDGSAGVWTCEGAVPAVEAVAAEQLTCSCDAPGGVVADATQTCNADGTGFEECACGCDTEIGRWITTYHREGRWVHDVSSVLPYVDDGGPQRYRFNTTGPYLLDMDMRFSSQEKQARPQEIQPLFRGGTINSSYNDNHPPVSFEVPVDAAKVELATVISGHGMNDPGNCAEFCNITHHFDINGGGQVDFEFPEAGSGYGCMEAVSEGTVPNQYGTWWYGRNGWCPGQEVPTVATDITDLVTLGAENTFAYEALFNGSDYTGSAQIRMRSYLVISR